MCLPVIGGIIGAVGSLASAAAQASGMRAQAKFQERQARLEQQRGAYESARQKDANDRRLANMRSQYLSSGVALSGSPEQVIEDSATEASLDEQAIKFGSQIKADNLRFEAQMSRMNARNAMIGGGLGALSSVVGGISQAREQNARRTMITNPYLAYG